MTKKMQKLRQAIADYKQTEGCSCCQDVDGHKEAEAQIASLLEVPMYDDLSGYDFNKFATNPV